MEADNVVMFALKILTRWMDGQKPLPEEIKRLRSCMPEMAHVAPDELACAVVREHQKRFWQDSSDDQPFAPSSQSRL